MGDPLRGACRGEKHEAKINVRPGMGHVNREGACGAGCGRRRFPSSRPRGIAKISRAGKFLSTGPGRDGILAGTLRPRPPPAFGGRRVGPAVERKGRVVRMLEQTAASLSVLILALVV